MYEICPYIFIYPSFFGKITFKCNRRSNNNVKILRIIKRIIYHTMFVITVIWINDSD